MGYTNQPQQGSATLPPGYQSVPTSGLPNYGSTVYVQQPPVPQPQILIVGGCPACRVGVLEDDFTCLGVCLAILFFPLGILCCLALRERRCPNCGAIFG
ncbi:membrane protein BRI3-like [Tachypleus tridentatus]